jgi:hypothetical protein
MLEQDRPRKVAAMNSDPSRLNGSIRERENGKKAEPPITHQRHSITKSITF